MANRKKGGAAHRSFLALPRLRAGHGLQAPVTSQWTENDRALALISRSIDVLNSAEKGHSIPDIFSQSIQFEFDLGIGNARAVEQWQGLLATLLLAGAGGQARVRPLDMDALGDAPFARIFRAVAARRGIEGMTLFELRRTDGSWGAVAFRFAGMPTMLCPAAEIRGPFVVDDPWLRQTERGWTFDAPLALVDDPRYGERRLALRNEIYALATREIPARENRDGPADDPPARVLRVPQPRWGRHLALSGQRGGARGAVYAGRGRGAPEFAGVYGQNLPAAGRECIQPHPCLRGGNHAHLHRCAGQRMAGAAAAAARLCRAGAGQAARGDAARAAALA